MKTVFKSDEIAHIWANKGATYGKSPGNLSFQGDAISSYLTVIARRISHKGRVAYLYDEARFSNSTSKSQGRIRAAIHDGAKVFTVNVGKYGQTLNWSPSELAKHYQDKAATLAAELPSRYAHMRARQYAEVTALLEQALDVCLFFGLAHKALDAKLAKRAAQMAQGADVLKAHRERLLEIERTKDARELKARTARNIEQAEKYLAGEIQPLSYLDLSDKSTAIATLPDDLRARFLAAAERNNAALVSKWQAGESVLLPHDAPTLLRTEDQEMVTSKGARVPLSDALRTYRFISAKRVKGWHRNGETHAIGAYSLEAVNDTGVVVGCHRVTWAEIERFAASQGWSNAA